VGPLGPLAPEPPLGLGLASLVPALVLAALSPPLAPMLVDLVGPRLPLVLRFLAAAAFGDAHQGSQPSIRARRASETSKFAVTF